MSSEHYECSVNSITDMNKREKELLARRNHFDVIDDILKEEIIKEEHTEINWSIENGESCQEEGQDEKFYEPVSSNCEENPRESKHSLTHFWENTNFDTKGSEYIFAADQEVDKIKNEIKVENDGEDFSEGPDDFSTTNDKLKRQILKTEDEIDIVFEDIKPGIHRDKLSGNKCLPNTFANIVPHESSIDFGAGPQQNTTIEEDETDVERDNLKQFQCNFCSNTFFKSSDLNIHERTHTGKKKIQCNFCSMSFTRSSILKVHEMSHTGEKPFQCNFCSKSFKQNHILKAHERIHTGENLFQCDFCLKSFTLNSELKSHKRIHTGEKPFQCKYCSWSFAYSGTLKNHERTHTGEKPFQCKCCSKSFSCSGTLRNHERTHTGETPFHCNFCSKSFTRSSSLKFHERIHTGEKPYKCNFCLKSFLQSSYLKKHEKRTHRGEK